MSNRLTVQSLTDCQSDVQQTDSPNNHIQRNHIHLTKPSKHSYGQFSNVLLSDEEYRKLTERYGDTLKDRIENLSERMASKGYTFKSHYATIISWANKDERDAAKKGGNHHDKRNPRALPKKYTDPDDLRHASPEEFEQEVQERLQASVGGEIK